MVTPLFGVIPAGSPVIIEPTTILSDTSFMYTLPDKHFTHIVVFLLPGVTLPPDTGAAIYAATAEEVTTASSTGRAPNFKFHGAVGQGKESSVFKITPSRQIIIGLSIEPSAAIATRLAELPTSSPIAPVTTGNTVLLAQKIIQNAFNFLASYSGAAGPSQPEMVPLKAFEAWWSKFESRLRSDPGFLDKQEE